MTDRNFEFDSTPQESNVAGKPRLRLRWSLLTLMLLAAVVCVWSMYFRFRYENPTLQASIIAMESLSKDLIVEDPNNAAAVHLPRRWYDESRWEIYIPETKPYRICLATREIRGEPQPTTQPAAVAHLAPGRYQVELRTEKNQEHERWDITVLVDDKQLLNVSEPLSWNPRHGSSGGPRHSRPYQPAKAHASIVLFNRRFMMSIGNGQYRTGSGPANGVELWLQPQD